MKNSLSKMKEEKEKKNKDTERDNTKKSNHDKVFNTAQMEALVQNDDMLANEYKIRAAGEKDEDGRFITAVDNYGYHWNEFILGILYNKFVKDDPKLFNKYKAMKQRAKPRTKRGELKLDEIDDIVNEIDDTLKEMEDAIEETTTSASSGSYVTPFAFNKKGNISKGMKEPNKKQKPITRLFATNTTVTEWLNTVKEMVVEEKRHPAFSLLDKIHNQNKENTTKDLKQSNLDNTKPEGGEFVETFKNKYDKDSLDPKESTSFKLSDEEEEYIKMNRGKGLHDVKFGRKPSDAYEDKMKKEMGDEMYKQRQDKIEYDKPMKDVSYMTQPRVVKDKQIEDPIKIKESIVFGKYKNAKNMIEFIKFNPFGAKLTENVSDFKPLIVEGIGNKLTDDVTKYYYFINEEDNTTYKKSKKPLNEESEMFKKMQRLMNYEFKNNNTKVNLEEETKFIFEHTEKKRKF